MKRLWLVFVALGSLLSGDVALAEVPVTVTVVNCALNVQANNGPVNALVDLTVMKIGTIGTIGSQMRHTEKIQTTASGTVNATVDLRQVFPGREINGLYGVSVDIGVTSVSVSSCVVPMLPSTSTSTTRDGWSALVIAAIGLMLGVLVQRRGRQVKPVRIA